jgi:demethylmenaquinone methyltransferase/2-methoxy-6-polyprenyl-1,4-benzoquinol methylase
MSNESPAAPANSPQPEKIRSMFAKVAANYDLANSVLSFGVHHLWRKKLVTMSQAKAGDAVLDCATGTGDLAIEFKRTVGTNGQVTGTDFCEEMLRPAPAKARSRRLNIRFEKADVMHLQYADNSFDVVSISFGIRNVENPLQALREMARVTKPGGRVMVLEFGQATLPLFSQIYTFYSDKILPVLGGLVTGQKDAYEYLQKSSSQFPCREEFLKLMRQTENFSSVEYESLTGGVAYIYKGVKQTLL